jgi:hypothetical protein
LQFFPLAAPFPKGGATAQPPPGKSSVQDFGPEIQKKSLTVAPVRVDVGTVIVLSTAGDTTYGFTGIAGRLVTLGLTVVLRRLGGALRRVRGALRTTSLREGPARPIALGVWRRARALSRVCTRRRGIAVPALEVAGVLNAAGRSGVGRVFALLLVLLVLDLG